MALGAAGTTALPAGSSTRCETGDAGPTKGLSIKLSVDIGIGREIEDKSLRRLERTGSEDDPCEIDSMTDKKLPELEPSEKLLAGLERDSLRRVRLSESESRVVEGGEGSSM